MESEERTVVGVTMLGHALVHTYELSIPVLIPVWLAQFDATPSTLGLVVGAGYALFGFGSVPSGLLADVYDARPLLVVCFAGMSAAFLGVSIASSLAILTLALLCWGVAASVYHPVGLSLISRAVTRRGQALGYHGIAGNVGVAVGPLVTILLLLAFDWRVATAALAVPGIVAAPLVWRLDMDEASLTQRGPDDGASGAADGGNEAVDNPAVAADGGFSLRSLVAYSRATFSGLFVVVFAIVIFEGLYYRGALTFLPDLLGGFSTFGAVDFFGRPLDPSRYLYVGLLVVGIGGQYAGGWLSDRIEPALGVAGAFAALAVIGVLFIPAATAGVVPLLAVSALLGFFVFGEQPLLQATVAEHSTADTRGISFGFMYAGIFGVGAAGAAITGYLLTYGSAQGMFGFLAFVGVLATGTALAVYWRG